MRSDVELKALRDIRVRRFLTQEELARRSGVSRVRITRFENGAKARLMNVAKIAAVLGVEPQELVGA